LLLEGDIELLKHSTFALLESERDSGHILLCKTHAYSDLAIELLNFDEDLIRRSIPVKSYQAELTRIEKLTHDIRRLDIELDQPLKFFAGQYVDITLPGGRVTRAFSMANPPNEGRKLSFIIKKYPQGAFSAALDETLHPGDRLTAKGPFGTCFRREGRAGPLLLIGGGSGMSPLRSILLDHIESGEQRPVRFFYGARTREDLFNLEEFAAAKSQLADFKFIPALSAADGDAHWDGERGFIHEVVARHLKSENFAGEIDAYSCGPPPMIDAILPVLQMSGVEPEHIYFDKFTPAVR
jgi:propane monooxygenase reductase subunit